MSEIKKPIPKTSLAEQELDRAQEQFQAFDDNVKALTLDRMNEAPRQEMEPQTKLSQNQIADAKDIYLKPKRSISSQEPFNEKWRADYNFDKEYVYFIAENKEIIGESIECWTKPYPGLPAEEWNVPVNKPIWGPRYLAEQIKRKFYHRLKMQQSVNNGADGFGQYYGALAVDESVPRLDARPATKTKSIFMGRNTF